MATAVRFEMSLTTDASGCNRLASATADTADACCADPACIDCATLSLVELFGPAVEAATLTHWPEPGAVVVNNLQSRARRVSLARALYAVIADLVADGTDAAKVERLRAIAAAV